MLIVVPAVSLTTRKEKHRNYVQNNNSQDFHDNKLEDCEPPIKQHHTFTQTKSKSSEEMEQTDMGMETWRVRK